jgi:hypothetical protein
MSDDWAVIRSSYPKYAAVGPIGKTTPQRIYHPSKWGNGREAFTDLSDVLLRGSCEACVALAAELDASYRLAEAERLDAYKRHQERERAAILKAGGSPR